MQIPLPPDFPTFRTTARESLRAGYLPDQLDLQDDTIPQPTSLLANQTPTGPQFPTPHVPKAFLTSAELASHHRDPNRWNLLYRLLHRLQSNRNLLRIEVDPDVAELRRLTSQVSRDLHKMHAFVRFRKLTEPGQPDHYIAFYRPDHRILPLAAPFFAERFATMRWTILTPDASATHDPATHQVTFAPGVPHDPAPSEDATEDLWRTYYASIFNPARLNPTAMRSEMPTRFWQHLPELAVLPHLIQKADTRVANMVTRQAEKTTAAPFVPDDHTLPVLARAMHKCEGCELYKHATQVVPGAGSDHARLLLVGEQPGDQEDLQGAPFVGPAGRVLRKALDELRIDPARVYMTNAVKHFKFVQRGKLRLHQSPRMQEINACKPWLLAELDAIKPRVVLCLGASAAKSLLGGTFALMKSRGTLVETPYFKRVIATIHPSAVLRAKDEAHDQLYTYLRDDLAFAWHTAQKAT